LREQTLIPSPIIHIPRLLFHAKPHFHIIITTCARASSRNFVVIAPTASGKTCVAELAMLQTLKSSRRAAYLVPLASIVNEKKEEFSYLSHDNSAR